METIKHCGRNLHPNELGGCSECIVASGKVSDTGGDTEGQSPYTMYMTQVTVYLKRGWDGEYVCTTDSCQFYED